MKKILLGMAAVLLACGVVLAADDAAKKEDAKGSDKAKKIVLLNFGKGDQFNAGAGVGSQSLSEEHLTGKEKMRMKVTGNVGILGLTKNVDWSKFNYIVFNAFLTGDKPWSGMMLLGDKQSYAKWGRNYVETSFSLKPGENKEVHIGIEGLYSSYASRALDMTNMQAFIVYGEQQLPETYFGNFYLVYEEE